MNLGKKIYKSQAPKAVGVVVLIGIILSIFSLYISIITDPKFIILKSEKSISLLSFITQYPHDLLAIIGILIIPGIYYGFIRGIIFYENGISINRGLPFFNRHFTYDQLASYSILHPDYLLQLKRKDTQDEVLISIGRMDRAIAILDQHLVREDAQSENLMSSTKIANLKLILIITIFSIIIFAAQHLGAFKPYLKN